MFRQSILAGWILTILPGGVVPDVRAGSLTCGITQISRSRPAAAAQIGAISSDGTRILLFSQENPTGENPDGNLEIFLLDLAQDHTAQITRTNGEGWFPQLLAASGDLRWAVFLSRRNTTGSFQLYLLDTLAREVEPLIVGDSGGPADVSQLTLSLDGSRLAFISGDNLTGENPDKSKELFVYDMETETLTQATQLSWTSQVVSISISGNGGEIAILKNHLSFSEIEVLGFPSLEPHFSYPGQRFGDIFLDAAGDRLFFVADIDPLGLNADGGPEIFMIQGKANLTPQALRQLTSFSFSSSPLLDKLAFSSDGKWIVFQSSSDWTEWNGNGSKNLFLLDVESGRLQQVTYSGSPFFGDFSFALSGDGRRVFFSARSDLVQANPTLNQEVFLADCEPARVRFFPQVGNGVWSDRRIKTELVFSSTGPNASVLIDFFDSNGDPLKLPLKNRGTASIFHFPVKTGSPLVLESTGFGTLAVGYARITTHADVTATAVFTGARSGTETILYEAGVPLTAPLSRFSMVVNTLGSYNTGLAIVNTHTLADPSQMEEPATVRFRLYSQSGDSLAYKELLLGPGHHRAFFVTELFSQVQNVGEMVGLLTADSDQPLAVISLRQNDDPKRPFPAGVPTLTTFPVSPMEPDRL